MDKTKMAAEAWPEDADERFDEVERFKTLMLSVRVPVRGAIPTGDADAERD